MRRYFAQRLGVLVVTVVAAVAIAHVFLNTTVEGYRLTTAIGGTPGVPVRWLRPGRLRRDVRRRLPTARARRTTRVKPCASYPAGEIADLLRHRVPIDLQLLLGGVLLGTLAGVWGGRRCALRPRSFSARVLHVATAFLLACPPYFLAFLILIYFADGSGTRAPAPVRVGRDRLHAAQRGPAAVPEGDVGAVGAVRAPARGVRAAA